MESFVYVMDKYAAMYDEKDNKLQGWGLPNETDFRQLFAMCPFYNSVHNSSNADSLNVKDVGFTLNARIGDNPVAFNFMDPENPARQVYWFVDPKAIPDKYGFKMMPAGGRLNGNVNIEDPYIGEVCNDLGPIKGCWSNLPIGSLYHLFYATRFATSSRTTITVHDLNDTQREESYHWRPVRWRRPLTDEELGYKLYIKVNGDQWTNIAPKLKNEGETPLLKELINNRISLSDIDIIKLSLEVDPDSSYVELPKGYIRDFYVQYFIDDPNSGKTIANITNYATKVQDHYLWSLKETITPKSATMNTPLQNKTGPSAILYPNPVGKTLHIKSDEPIDALKIYSMSGSIVLSKTQLQTKDIDVSSLSAGTYIVKIWIKGKMETHKIIKVKLN